MSVIIRNEYLGDDQVRLTHPSGAMLETDLPIDNGGRGRAFSPTDLMTASLSSCVLSIMALAGRKEDLDLRGTTIDIEKRMQANPRRIAALEAVVHFPEQLTPLQKKKLLRCVKICPVHRSLHPDVEVIFREGESQ